MHYKRASPAGSKAAAIVQNMTAIGQQGETCYSATSKVPLSKDKRWQSIKTQCFLSFHMKTWTDSCWEHLTYPRGPLSLLQFVCLQPYLKSKKTSCNQVVSLVICLLSLWVVSSQTNSHINSCSDHRCVSNKVVSFYRPQNFAHLPCFFLLKQSLHLKLCEQWKELLKP